MRREKLEQILAKEYGITSDRELVAAISNLPKLDISIFVTPVPKDNNDAESDSF